MRHSSALFLSLLPLTISTPTLPVVVPYTTTTTVTVTVPGSSCPSSTALPASSSSSLKQCTNYTVALPITSINQVFAGQPFNDNADLTDFIQNFTARVPISAPAFNANVSDDATYTLSGTFCTPAAGSDGESKRRGKTVLLATHGLNFDRSYWDLPIESEKYSFVDAAVKEGYSVFFYDRLGVGESQK